MTIVFTICSNNYLAQAKTLIDSVHKYNPEFKLFIGLVDKSSDQIDYSFFEPAKVIPVKKIGIKNFNELIEKYDIVELNTAVKPAFFRYLMLKYSFTDDILIYLDPDIKVFASFNYVEKILKKYDILLTPHIYTAIPQDNLQPQEWLFLKHGLYNLGFLALKTNSDNSNFFIKWWQERCFQYGLNKPEWGLFVDQKWIDLVPLFFKKVHIIKNYGYNMAPWNLHERIIEKQNNKYVVNNKEKLVFYHFSSFNYKEKIYIAKPFYNRYNFRNRADLFVIYDEYYSDLINNKIAFFSSIECKIIKKKEVLISKENKWKKFFPPVLYSFLSRTKNKWKKK